MNKKRRLNMPKRPKEGEYARFEMALKKILTVPHPEMKSKLDAARRKRTKKSSASHVSAAQD